MTRTRLLFLLMLLSFGVFGNAQKPASRPPERRLESIHKLGLPKLPTSDLPTYYSPGADAQARRLQQFTSGERNFYRQALGLPLPDITLAVLNPEQWSAVSTHNPYGMPSVEGTRVIVMPADWRKARIIPIPKLAELTPSVRKRVTDTGKPMADLIYVGTDGIGAHELGHIIVEDYGIGYPTFWLKEFLASYVGEVYVEEERPEDRAGTRVFWESTLILYPHPHTSLEYFENHYNELSEQLPENYGWYQCALAQRVIAVHQKEGIRFLAKAKESFPKGEPPMTTAQTLDKLEAITPGWKKWAADLEADRVQAQP